VEISKAVPGDAAAMGRLHAIVHNLHVENLERHFKTVDVYHFVEVSRATLKQPNAYTVVARIDGEVAGFAVGVIREAPESLFAKETRHLYLDRIAVDPAFRRKGIGRELVQALLNHARRAGLGQVVLDTWEFNEGARSFFLSMGFKRQMQRLSMGLD
jgi:ribosomal protein S18 acetylase RimI-like enzyme